MNYINNFTVGDTTYPVTGIRYNSLDSNLYTINASIDADGIFTNSNICLSGNHTISSGSGIVVNNIFVGPTLQYTDNYSSISHTGNITLGGLPIIGSYGSLAYDNIFVGGGFAVSNANNNVFIGGGAANGCAGKLFISGGHYDSTYTSEATTFLPGTSNFMYTKTISLYGSYNYSSNRYANSGTLITTIPGDKTTIFHIKASTHSGYVSQTLCYLMSYGMTGGKPYSSGIGWCYNGVNPTGGATSYFYIHNDSSYFGSAWHCIGVLYDVDTGVYNNTPLVGLRDFNTAESFSARDDVVGLYMFTGISSKSLSNVFVEINQIVID